MTTPLAKQLAARIGDYLRSEGVPAGTRLVERKLAGQLRVSRSPVRSALRLLQADGVVGEADQGGFVVFDTTQISRPITTDPQENEELYYRIADDRLCGVLPDRVSESALMRRYHVTRAQLSGVLRRIVGEGWMERLPGHGWMFMPMLTSMQAYEDSYRFRLAIEPAAILEPSFELDVDGLANCREKQQSLIDGEIWSIPKATLFDLNSHLHETVIACSRNLFFAESLRRVDRVRRLMEYRQALDRQYAIQRCREHVVLVDLLLARRNMEAADFMRRHLESVSVQKTTTVDAS